MPPLNATLEELLAYLRDKATRYGLIARSHIERAEVWKRGTDQLQPNGVMADRYEAAARAALTLAQNYTGYALCLSYLRPLEGLEPGDPALIPATFLRRASAEDFPGEGFVKLAGDQVVRLPLHLTAQA
jgi:hypothetical protein